MFKTVQELIDYLNPLGYVTDPYYGYLDGYITDITLMNRYNKRMIVIFCSESDEYKEYLETLPEGTEYITDFSRCVVDNIFIQDECLIYPSYDALPYSYNAGIVIPNNKELFDIALNAVNNKSNHVKNIYLKHFENMDNFLSKYSDLFKKYNIVETYNSMLDFVNRDADSSSPAVCFGIESEGPFGSFMSVWTDALTGKFCGDTDNVEKLIKEELQKIQNYKDVVSKEQAEYTTGSNS